MDLTSELNTTKNQMPHQFLKSSFKKNYNVFILFKFVFIYFFATNCCIMLCVCHYCHCLFVDTMISVLQFLFLMSNPSDILKQRSWAQNKGWD